MKTGLVICLTVLFSVLAAAEEKNPSGELKGTQDAAGTAIAPAPIDSEATPETKALFHNLRKQMGKGILFGHQHATLYGIGWNSWDNDGRDRGRSDVKAATGAYPAVYGWDFIRIPFEKEANATMVALHRELMIEAYQRGGINTVSWHMDNPVTGRKYSDRKKAMHTIKPGGEKHEWYKRALDHAAAFFKSLKTEDGVLVPIIFRPFHEQNRSGFWWPHASREDYNTVWRFTVTYLRDVKGVHNLLYANSPGHGCKSLASYRNLLPEKDYVDLYGVDCYFKTSAKEVLVDIRVAVEAAEQDGKIAALTEGGNNGGMSARGSGEHYTKQFLDPIKSDPVASKIAYMLVWRNAGPEHHWVPVKGDSQFEDFKKFAKDPAVIFEDRLPPMYVGDRP